MTKEKAVELPRHLLGTPIIAGMKVGDVGYTMDWAMSVDLDHRCYLSGNYPVSLRPQGTSKMKIARKKEGYCVYASDTGERWHLSDTLHVVGPAPSDLIPVAEVI